MKKRLISGDEFIILEKKDIIAKIKQLGMMHILYAIRKTYSELIRNPHIRKILTNDDTMTLEETILTYINTENKIISELDRWEKHIAKKQI